MPIEGLDLGAESGGQRWKRLKLKAWKLTEQGSQCWFTPVRFVGTADLLASPSRNVVGRQKPWPY